MSQAIAERNIRIQTWINFVSGIVFLVPIITLFYQYSGLSLAHIILIANISTITIRLFELPTSVFADTMGRKKSLIISVVCNFVGALSIFLFPSFLGFILASIFAGLYWSFWSGTGQAFLEENLRTLGREKEFGKKIGNLMALETLAGIITPIVASGLLKYFGDQGYTILAGLDLVFAGILIILTIQLKESYFIQEEFMSWKTIIVRNIDTTKQAIQNVFQDKNLRLLLIYRSLSNHVSFFFVVSLPILVEGGMEERASGIITAIAGIAMMISNKYAYKIGEKKGYHLVRIYSTIAQAIILIVAGFLIKSWIFLALMFVVFNFFEGLWIPARNHVLVEQTKGVAIATTRSIIFSVFALYTTLGKQVLSLFDVKYALIASGICILCINLIYSRKILAIQKQNHKPEEDEAIV